MDKLEIIGGNPLCGEVSISGAKNAALPILCASLLTKEQLFLRNVPDLQDVRTMCKLLAKIGVKIDATIDNNGQNIYCLQAAQLDTLEAPYELVKTMRATILVLGPLLARYGEAKVSLPGGCAIGARPVDQHIKGLRAMGAEINIEHGYIYAKAARLYGAHIFTDMITVTGTANLLMAAVLAEGETILENAAREPEIVDLANLLVTMGANIAGIGSNTLCVYGVPALHGACHTVIPDRIEVGTFLCAAAATRGKLLLKQCMPLVLDVVLDKLRESGLIINCGCDWIKVSGLNRPCAVNVRTSEYPAFPTDMQAQFMALISTSKGSGLVTETIFENRFMHVQELKRLGANIIVKGNTALVSGVKSLSGATVMATDLRSSASLVIAGLCAEGKTTIERIYHLDRGYEALEEKLSNVGAKIKRINSSAHESSNDVTHLSVVSDAYKTIRHAAVNQ